MREPVEDPGDDGRRPGHAGRDDQPVDLGAVHADDALLDALGSGRLRPDPELAASDDPDERLAAMLAGWVTAVQQPAADEPHTPEPAEAPRTTATQPAAVALSPWRARFLVRLAAAALFTLVVLSGLAIGAQSARPGDPLWTVTQVLYTEHARSIEAATAASDGLERARAALQEGRTADAVRNISRVRSALPEVRPGDGRDALVREHDQLIAKLPPTAGPTPGPTAGRSAAATGRGPAAAPSHGSSSAPAAAAPDITTTTGSTPAAPAPGTPSRAAPPAAPGTSTPGPGPSIQTSTPTPTPPIHAAQPPTATAPAADTGQALTEQTPSTSESPPPTTPPSGTPSPSTPSTTSGSSTPVPSPSARTSTPTPTPTSTGRPEPSSEPKTTTRESSPRRAQPAAQPSTTSRQARPPATTPQQPTQLTKATPAQPAKPKPPRQSASTHPRSQSLEPTSAPVTTERPGDAYEPSRTRPGKIMSESGAATPEKQHSSTATKPVDRTPDAQSSAKSSASSIPHSSATTRTGTSR